MSDKPSKTPLVRETKQKKSFPVRRRDDKGASTSGGARGGKKAFPGEPAPAQAGVAPRRLVLDALIPVLRDHLAFDDIFDALARSASERGGMEARDIGFARALALTTLRHWGEAQALLAMCLKEPLPRRAGPAEFILAMGAAEMLILGTPAHAAVSSAVNLADGNRQAKAFKGLINAVLRRLSREGQDLLAAMDRPKQRLPSWLWTSWSAAYGEQAARAISETLTEEPALHLALKKPDEAAMWVERLGAEQIDPFSLMLKGAGRVDRLPGFEEGAWWVQDYAATLPARLFGEVSGVEVLDLCAAPGGKTMALAARGARVTAVDRARGRLRRIRENLKRVGLQAEVLEGDVAEFQTDHQWPCVLLDAPCSSTGTIRRHPDVAWTKRPGDRDALIGEQEKLLDAAARLVAPGGCLVYCVCSLEPQEGDNQIETFLARHSDWGRVPIEPWEVAGHADFINRNGDLRTLPSQGLSMGGLDGFFAARLRRS